MLQIFEFRRGFWIFDFGDFGLDFGDFGFWILGVLDFGFWLLGILDPKKIQNPKSTKKLQNLGRWGLHIKNCYITIQNPKSKIPKIKILGTLDFGFWIRGILNFRFWGFWLWILDLGDFGFWIWEFWISDCGSWGFWILGILDFGFSISGVLDFGLWGFWILDFGPLCSKSLCETPNAPNLGILNFGFWGFWGFWILGILGILDVGLWILDFEVWGMEKFGCKVSNKIFGFYIRVRRLCTPPRVGGFNI